MKRAIIAAALFLATSTSAALATTAGGLDTPTGVTSMPLAIGGTEVLRVTPQGLLIPNAAGVLDANALTTLVNLLNTPACATGQSLTKLSATTFACTKGQPATTAQTTDASSATFTDPSGVSPSSPGTSTTSATSNCTAIPAICAAYQQQTGRLPDAVGSNYWTAEYNAYTQAGLSPAAAQAKVEHDMSGTPEATAYATTGVASTAPATANLGGTTVTSPTCSGSTGCGSNAELTPLVSAPADPVTQAYQQLLGRAPDQAGAAYYEQQTAGMSATQAAAYLQSAIGNSPEAKAYQASGTSQIGVGYSSNGTNAEDNPLCINGVACQ